MQQNQKVRIALGVFDDLAKLRRALDEIQTAGIEIDDIELIADAAVLSGQLAPAFKTGQGAPDPISPPVFIRGKKIGSAGGSATHSRDVASLAPSIVSQFEDWISSKLSDPLNEHLAQGACVLLVPVTATDPERVICEILLRYSAEAVQLHDVPKAGKSLKYTEKRTF